MNAEGPEGAGRCWRANQEGERQVHAAAMCHRPYRAGATRCARNNSTERACVLLSAETVREQANARDGGRAVHGSQASWIWWWGATKRCRA